jgi:hypothetical protein
MLIILATQEAKIRRIMVRSQPGQIIRKTLSQRNSSPKRAGGVAQGVGPQFKLPLQKKEKRKKIKNSVPPRLGTSST